MTQVTVGGMTYLIDPHDSYANGVIREYLGHEKAVRKAQEDLDKIERILLDHLRPRSQYRTPIDD